RMRSRPTAARPLRRWFVSTSCRVDVTHRVPGCTDDEFVPNRRARLQKYSRCGHRGSPPTAPDASALLKLGSRDRSDRDGGTDMNRTPSFAVPFVVRSDGIRGSETGAGGGDAGCDVRSG